MNEITTKTGDSGTTAIYGGRRVSKTDPRIEANGALDELNVAIGIARSFLPTDSPMQPHLRDIQLCLMRVMSRVATPSDLARTHPTQLTDALVASAESLIEEYQAQTPPATHFILPGGTQASAFLHQARVAARRAERRLWDLNDIDPVDPTVTTWLNRLSDLFFIMARAELLHSGISEERWKLFRRIPSADTPTE